MLKLTSEQSAEQLLKDARRLRNSPDLLASNIFFNPDLLPQQRQLAYEARCWKRQRRLAAGSVSPRIISGTANLQTDALRHSLSLLSSQLPAATTTTSSYDTATTGSDQQHHPSSDSISRDTHQPHSESAINGCWF